MLLAEKVDPRRAALVVIDVQNDFCKPGGFMDREGQDLSMVEAMLPRLQRFLSEARQTELPIIFVQAIYGTDANWYLSPTWLDRARRSLPAGGHTRYKVCAEGGWGAELCDGIAPDPSRPEIVIRKHRYSAFVNTELDLILRSRGIQTVLLTGVATNVCVESTARDAFLRDYFVVLVEDCCATYSKFEQDGTVWNVRKYFGEVVPSEQIVAIWKGGVLQAEAGDPEGVAERS